MVDNGSREPPDAVVGRFPGVIAGARAAPGPGPARNRGARWRGGRSSPSPTPTACRNRAGSPPSTPASPRSPALEILGGEVRIFPETPEDVTPAEAFQMLYAYRQKLYITPGGLLGDREPRGAPARLRRGRTLRRPRGGRGRGLGPARHPRGTPHRLCPGGSRPSPRSPQHGRAPRHLGPPRDAFLPPGAGAARATPLGADHPADGALAAASRSRAILGARGLAPRERWRAFRGLAAIRLYRAFRMAPTLAGGRDGAPPAGTAEATGACSARRNVPRAERAGRWAVRTGRRRRSTCSRRRSPAARSSSVPSSWAILSRSGCPFGSSRSGPSTR